MRLSTRSRYGVRLMLALGLSDKKEPIFLKDIAKSEEISEKYLSQIIIPLKANGLINTFRGAHGGYILSRPASQIKSLKVSRKLVSASLYSKAFKRIHQTLLSMKVLLSAVKRTKTVSLVLVAAVRWIRLRLSMSC